MNHQSNVVQMPFRVFNYVSGIYIIYLLGNNTSIRIFFINCIEFHI